MTDEIGLMFLPLIGVLAVILLAYFGTNWLLKKYKKKSPGRYIKVIERTMLSQDKSLLLVEAADHVYLLGVTNQGIGKIDVFDPESFPKPEQAAAGNDFASILATLTSSIHLKNKPHQFDNRQDREKL